MPAPKYPDNETMIEELEAKEDGLSPWELDFVESVRDKFNDGQLTDGQIEKLQEVWEKRCNK